MLLSSDRVAMDGRSRVRAMGPDGGGRRSSWFHQSLDQLSQGLRTTKLGASIANLLSHHRNNSAGVKLRNNKKNGQNKKANRCSSWFVEPYRPSVGHSLLLIRSSLRNLGNQFKINNTFLFYNLGDPSAKSRWTFSSDSPPSKSGRIDRELPPEGPRCWRSFPPPDPTTSSTPPKVMSNPFIFFLNHDAIYR